MFNSYDFRKYKSKSELHAFGLVWSINKKIIHEVKDSIQFKNNKFPEPHFQENTLSKKDTKNPISPG